MDGKQNLADTAFDSLDAMMIAYAGEAVKEAAERHEKLDFSESSIAAVERCLALIAPEGQPPEDVNYLARVWGAYLGEVVRTHYGGSWDMSQYPGSALAVPAIDVRGSHLYPTMKVFRRLTMGDTENVDTFYQMVARRLGTPTTIH
jgi:hypothetical protein